MRMKNTLALLVIGILLVGCTQYAEMPQVNNTAGGETHTGGVASAAGKTVRISGFAFNPAEITVKQGTTVTWINDDSAPHMIRMAGKPDSPQLAKGGSYSYTFTDAPGEYGYSCGIHPSMLGKVIVTG